MKRPMSRHQDLRFITTLGQTQEQSLLMYPTAEEEEEAEGGPPPPPPGNLGALQGLFGTRTGNMPIQSGYYAQQFSQNPVVMPVYPNAPYNTLVEEGMYPGLEPPQPGLLRRIGQNIADSAREGAINQAGQMGAAVGAGAVSLAGQALRRAGGAIRDGAAQYGQDFLDLYWRGRLPGGPPWGDLRRTPFG